MKSDFFLFFKTVFGTVFLMIITILLLFENMEYACKREFILSNGVIFCTAIIFLLISVLFYYWFKNNTHKFLRSYPEINFDKLVLISVVILFFGQCYVFYNIFFLSGWDSAVIRDSVNTILSGGDKANTDFYFSRYPNNLFISYLYLFILKINNTVGIFNGIYSYMCIVILNCAINSFSCWLSYKTARIFVSPAFALVAYISCVFSFGVSGWSVICYSDAIALFIPILSIYLYCKQYKTTKTQTVGFISAVFVSVVGYFIKPQCLFVLIAIIILEVLRFFINFSLKKLLRPITLCLVAVMVFSFTNIGLNHLNKKYGVQIDKEQTFGFSHFLMMGANQETNGVYFQDDVHFSGSFATSAERNKANIDVFKERVISMKGGLITHLTKKILTTFNDGTFAWGSEGNFIIDVPDNINNKMAPFLKSIYHFGDRFNCFATFQHIVWFFILICSFLTVFSNKENFNQIKLSLFWIVLLGFVLYEMLFEARARYIYIFVPLLCTMVPIGIRNISILVCDIVPHIKNKLKG